jgi:hypothetical protein
MRINSIILFTPFILAVTSCDNSDVVDANEKKNLAEYYLFHESSFPKFLG